MAKLPVGVRKIVNQIVDEQIPHLADIIKMKRDSVGFLADHIDSRPVAYYEGLLAGAYATVEQLLMAYNCYNGYAEVQQIMIDGQFKDVAEHRRYFLPR